MGVALLNPHAHRDVVNLTWMSQETRHSNASPKGANSRLPANVTGMVPVRLIRVFAAPALETGQNRAQAASLQGSLRAVRL